MRYRDKEVLRQGQVRAPGQTSTTSPPQLDISYSIVLGTSHTLPRGDLLQNKKKQSNPYAISASKQ
jgi:hypothetical protein